MPNQSLHLIPTALDLQHWAIALLALASVASLLFMYWLILDTIRKYGAPTFHAAPLVVTIRVPRPFSQRASKGFTRPTVVPFVRQARRG